MIIHVYEADEFRGGRESEQRVLYFEERKEEGHYCTTFEEFIKYCMVYEKLLDAPFIGSGYQTIYEIEKEVNDIYPTAVKVISNEDFLKNKHLSQLFFPEELVKSKMDFPSRIIKCVSVYEQEWNYLFHAAESDVGFYGYNWITTA